MQTIDGQTPHIADMHCRSHKSPEMTPKVSVTLKLRPLIYWIREPVLVLLAREHSPIRRDYKFSVLSVGAATRNTQLHFWLN